MAARNGTRSRSTGLLDRGRPVVGVHGCGAQPGKVLGGGGHAAVAHPPDRSTGSRGDPALVTRERTGGHDGAHAWHVRDRREVDVHAGVPEAAAGRARHAAHVRRRALERLPCARPYVLHRADVAALLVDHDERPAVPRLLKRAREPAPVCGVTAVRGAEQDHAGRLAPAQPPADVLGPRRARKARDRDLTDLLPERQPVDGLARSLEVALLLRGRRRGFVPRAAAVTGANGSTEEQGAERRTGQRGEPPPPDLASGPPQCRRSASVRRNARSGLGAARAPGRPPRRAPPRRRRP